MPSSSRFKCYFDCACDGPLHRFPKPIYPYLEKFNVWRNVLSRNIQEKGNNYIYNQIRLCNKHFDKNFISNSNRLTSTAVPTLCLYEHQQQDTDDQMIERPSTTAREHQQQDTDDQMIERPSTAAREQQQQSQECLVIDDPMVGMSTAAATEYIKTSHPQTIIKKMKKTILLLNKRCKNEKKKFLLMKKYSLTKSFLKVIDKMPEPIKKFTAMQLKWKKKPRGRRFDLDEKIMALTIYKQSQKCYNLLRKLFVLPSKRSLQKILSSFNLKPGINAQIMQNLKDSISKVNQEKRLFTLLFDEVALSTGLFYDEKKDEIIGFEDTGCSKYKRIADHALVFMIKGIKTKKKQPICFTFCQGTTNKFEMKRMIKTLITELSNAGIIIVATICDQATTNVATIKSLREDTREKYLKSNREYQSTAIEIEETKIFPLFDTPHLLKGIRNNFMTKNIKFTQDGKEKLVRWEHLKMLLELDTGEDELRLVNKLTECHINPEKINKMKVKLAAQVFSQRVSSAIRFLARHKILPEECEETADLLLIFDKLFDSFNGHSYNDSAKILKGCVKNNSPHFKFWNETLPILESMEFLITKKGRDGSCVTKYEKIPSLQNWIHNIKAFKEMWRYLQENYHICNIIPRNFNQDPLENFFSCIRSNGIRNINPTCLQFINAYKTLLINQFDSPHSISANCEKDNNKSIQSLTSLLVNTINLPCNPDFACDIDSLLITLDEIKLNDSNNLLHKESKKYVAGYVIKKCKTKICKSCSICTNDLLRSERDIDSFNHEVDYTKKSLFHASDALINLLNEIYYMIVTCMKETPEMIFLKQKIIFFIKCRCDFDSVFTCINHKVDLIEFIVKLSIKLIIHSWCTGINRILSGKMINFDQNDSTKLQAFNYYKRHCKRKK